VILAFNVPPVSTTIALTPNPTIDLRTLDITRSFTVFVRHPWSRSERPVWHLFKTAATGKNCERKIRTIKRRFSERPNQRYEGRNDGQRSTGVEHAATLWCDASRVSGMRAEYRDVASFRPSALLAPISFSSTSGHGATQAKLAPPSARVKKRLGRDREVGLAERSASSPSRGDARAPAMKGRIRGTSAL
jgi:hypothetical protein